MPIKRNPPVIFTNSMTLDELKEGTNTKAKCISAKVLKDFIEYCISENQHSVSVSGDTMIDSEEDNL